MKTLAVYNIKGGVGKTAAAVNLGYLAAQEGARVLVWDLDPQAAASFYFRIQPRIKGGTRSLLKKSSTIEAFIKGTDYPGLDLLPADFSYRQMDVLLSDAKKPNRLRKLLKPLEPDYDYVIIDCPPGITAVSENIFTAVDALVVPLIPTTLSLRTFELLLEFCVKSDLKSLRILPFFSMVDIRKRLHREMLERLPSERPGFLGAQIPYASEVEQMGAHRAPLPAYAPHSRSTVAYYNLWREIRRRVG